MLDDIAPRTKRCLNILIADGHGMPKPIRERDLVQDD